MTIAPLQPKALFAADEEIAKLVLGDKAKARRDLVAVFEREGLPRTDPMTGGRYWPAVKAFFDRRAGITTTMVPGQPDGEEAMARAKREAK